VREPSSRRCIGGPAPARPLWASKALAAFEVPIRRSCPRCGRRHCLARRAIGRRRLVAAARRARFPADAARPSGEAAGARRCCLPSPLACPAGRWRLSARPTGADAVPRRFALRMARESALRIDGRRARRPWPAHFHLLLMCARCLSSDGLPRRRATKKALRRSAPRGPVRRCGARKSSARGGSLESRRAAGPRCPSRARRCRRRPHLDLAFLIVSIARMRAFLALFAVDRVGVMPSRCAARRGGWRRA